MLPLRARLNLGGMALKGSPVFPQTPALLDPRHQIVYFGLVSLFYGISTFVGYLMPNLFS